MEAAGLYDRRPDSDALGQCQRAGVTDKAAFGNYQRAESMFWASGECQKTRKAAVKDCSRARCVHDFEVSDFIGIQTFVCCNEKE